MGEKTRTACDELYDIIRRNVDMNNYGSEALVYYFINFICNPYASKEIGNLDHTIISNLVKDKSYKYATVVDVIEYLARKLNIRNGSAVSDKCLSQILESVDGIYRNLSETLREDPVPSNTVNTVLNAMSSKEDIAYFEGFEGNSSRWADFEQNRPASDTAGILSLYFELKARNVRTEVLAAVDRANGISVDPDSFRVPMTCEEYMRVKEGEKSVLDTVLLPSEKKELVGGMIKREVFNFCFAGSDEPAYGFRPHVSVQRLDGSPVSGITGCLLNADPRFHEDRLPVVLTESEMKDMGLSLYPTADSERYASFPEIGRELSNGTLVMGEKLYSIEDTDFRERFPQSYRNLAEKFGNRKIEDVDPRWSVNPSELLAGLDLEGKGYLFPKDSSETNALIDKMTSIEVDRQLGHKSEKLSIHPETVNKVSDADMYKILNVVSKVKDIVDRDYAKNVDARIDCRKVIRETLKEMNARTREIVRSTQNNIHIS